MLPAYGSQNQTQNTNNYGMNRHGYPNTTAPGNLWVGNNYTMRSGDAMWHPTIPSGQQSQQLGQNNIIRVMGPESAMGYQIDPNSDVILMDTSRPVFYRKRSDDAGFAETRAYEFHEVPLMEQPVEVEPVVEKDIYATKEDIAELKKLIGRKDSVTKKEFDNLRRMVEGMRGSNE